MIFLRAVCRKTSEALPERFPFSLRILKDLHLDFSSPVTFFVGENGTGKSTLLEAVAWATGLPVVGGEPMKNDATLRHAGDLAAALRLVWSKRTHRGFFLRAEDFFRFCRSLQGLAAKMDESAAEFEKQLTGYGLSLARGAVLGQKAEITKRYGDALDGRSHGESFFRLFHERFAPSGLYLLDEPETPLSPQRQLALLSMLKMMADEQDAQFLIATHSPLLMAYPGAVIYCFDNGAARPAAYDELECVNLTRRFLADPGQFLRRL